MFKDASKEVNQINFNIVSRQITKIMNVKTFLPKTIFNKSKEKKTKLLKFLIALKISEMKLNIKFGLNRFHMAFEFRFQ